MSENPTPPAPEREAEIVARLGYDPIRHLRRAISDPGSLVARGDDFTEPLVSWQARAVMAAIGENLFEELDAHAEANHELYAEVERLRAELEAAQRDKAHVFRAATARVERLERERDEARARVAELERQTAAATEYRVGAPTGLSLYVRRAPGRDGWAVFEARTAREGRRAWTPGGWQILALLAHSEMHCWPDDVTALAEARKALATEGGAR